VGVDYQQEHLPSDTDFLRDDRNNTGVFGLYQGQFGQHEIQLSARHNQPGRTVYLTLRYSPIAR
jgi:vitamin B12 transporter